MKKAISLGIFSIAFLFATVFAVSPVSAQTAGAGVLTATVNVGNTPDSKIVVAGSAMQKVGSFKFTAQNTSFTIQDLRVKTFGESNNSSISSVTLKYKDAGGIEKTASQPLILSSAGGLATYTGLTAFIPQNTERDIDVYVDVSTIASGANSGALIIVSLDSSGGFKAFDSNGVVDTTLASQDLSSSVTSGKGTLVVRRSVPTLSSVQDYSEILMAGGNQIIGKVKISANPAGDIGWKKIVFNYTKSANITLNTLKLYNQAANTEISGTFSNPATGQLIFTTTNEEQIAAGSSVTYELRATVGGLGVGVDTVVVSIANTSTTGVTASASTAGATGPASPSFIWTDRSASAISGGTVHSLNTLDWTNDLMVKTLPLTIGSKSNYGIGDGTVTPPVVTPPTTDESALIAQLQALIAQLLEQLKAQGYEIDANGNLVKVEPTPTQPPLPIDFCYVWGKNLTIGATGPDVDALVRAMVREGFLVRAPGENIQGEDFNEILAEAVVKFQGKYGISPKSGFVGPKTRAQLGALYGGNCDSQTSSITLVSPNGGEVYRPGDTINVRWSPVGMPSGGFVKLSLLREDQIGIYDTLIVKYPDAGVNQCLFSATSSSDCVPINSGSVNVLLRSDIAPGKYKVQVSCFMWGAQNVCPGAEFAESVDVSDLSFTVSNSTPVSDATATVTGSPTLELIYDASQKEASLRAIFDVTVNGGTKGVKIAVGEGLNLPDFFKGSNQVNVNSMTGRVVVLNPDPTAMLAGFDLNGTTFAVVPINSSANFRVVSTVDPRQLFAGEYAARLQMMYALSGETAESGFKIPVVSNTSRGQIAITNPKIIVGEVSPYISSMTNPVVPGQTVKLLGQRLNAFGNTGPSPKVVIDNVAIDLGNSYYNNDGSESGFIAPATLANGRHSLQTENSVTGKSNIVWFEVGGSVESSVRVISPNGVTWTKGQNNTISWRAKSYPSSGYVALFLNNQSNTVGVIKNIFFSPTQAITNESYTWDTQTLTSGSSDSNGVPILPPDIQTGSYQVRVAVIDTSVPASKLFYADSSAFIINASSTPPAGANLSAEISREMGDQAGQWYTFKPDGTKDWVWNMYLNLTTAKKIKAISIVHGRDQSNGEAWSTSATTTLQGRLLYPIVVTTIRGGIQLNSTYDQMYSPTSSAPDQGSFQFPAGSHTLKLYGNTGMIPFQGGTIIVDFTDGTSVASSISASDYVPGSPVTPPSIPFISLYSPNGGQNYKVGDNVNITWNVSNFPRNSTIGLQLSYKSNGSIFEDVLSSSLSPNLTGYLWTIPSRYGGVDMNPKTFKIRAIVYTPDQPAYNPPQDYSDNYFTITANSPITPSTFSVYGPWVVSKQSSSVYTGDLAQFTSTRGDTSFSYSCGTDGQLTTSPLNPDGIMAGTFYCVYNSAGQKTVTISSGSTVLAQTSFSVASTVVPTPVPTIQPTTIPTITFNINGQPYSSVSQLTAGTNMNLTWTAAGAEYCEARSGGSFDALWTGEKARTSGTQTITVPADMTGMKAIAIQCRNAAGWQISTAFFSVVAPVTATSPTVSTPSVLAPALSASLSQVYENKAGMWNTFAPGVNSVGKANDFVWNSALTLGESKTIKSIDMNHNVGGEYWSTSNTGAYPLVIFYNGSQVNTAYGQTLGTYGAGTTNLTVYGQHERAYFSGGILKVTFTDNTTVSATVPGVSTFSPAVPAQTGAALDAMYDILQSMLKQLR